MFVKAFVPSAMFIADSRGAQHPATAPVEPVHRPPGGGASRHGRVLGLRRRRAAQLPGRTVRGGQAGAGFGGHAVLQGGRDQGQHDGHPAAVVVRVQGPDGGQGKPHYKK